MPTFTVVITNEQFPSYLPAFRIGPNVLMAYEAAAQDAARYDVPYLHPLFHRRLFERCRKVMRRHSPEPVALAEGPLTVSVCLHP